jgi:hypothetical protein
MESYISDENKLEEISRKWQKANQPDEWPDETND